MNFSTFLFLMFCRWNITIYTGKVFPIVFWMKSLRFSKLKYAVTSKLCLILENFGSTDLYCCCTGSQFGGPVSLESPALMLLFCLVWLSWRWRNLKFETQNHGNDKEWKVWRKQQFSLHVYPCWADSQGHVHGTSSQEATGSKNQRLSIRSASKSRVSKKEIQNWWGLKWCSRLPRVW